MAEIVDLPIKDGGSFHSYGTVYQRVKVVSTNLAKVPGHHPTSYVFVDLFPKAQFTETSEAWRPTCQRVVRGARAGLSSPS
jgi:hypothetical protein